MQKLLEYLSHFLILPIMYVWRLNLSMQCCFELICMVLSVFGWFPTILLGVFAGYKIGHPYPCMDKKLLIIVEVKFSLRATAGFFNGALIR